MRVKKSGRTTGGNKWLKSVLVQCALGASVKKDTYLRSKYYKLKARMGAKKAVIAIGHKILVSIFFVLRDRGAYRELGANYLDNGNKDKTLRHYRKKLEQLGYKVSFEETVAA